MIFFNALSIIYVIPQKKKYRFKTSKLYTIIAINEKETSMIWKKNVNDQTKKNINYKNDLVALKKKFSGRGWMY
jgi:hypothetical protein